MEKTEAEALHSKTAPEIFLRVISEQKIELAGKDLQIEILTAENKRLLAEFFGRSSERHTGEDAETFDEKDQPEKDLAAEEVEAADVNADADETVETEDISYTRKKKGGKSGRKALPLYLERIRVEYTLPESELIAPEGFLFVKIGEVVTETLDVTPAKVHVIQHVRFQYACREREEFGVKIAPVPEQVIPKSIASAGLLAHVLIQKYCYHLPYYRQEQIWRDLEVNLPRNTLCTWLMKCAEVLQPLVPVLKNEILKDGYVHADETTVSVQTQTHEKKKGKDKNKTAPDKPQIHLSYMWTYLNPIEHLVLFDYQEGRAGLHPWEFFEGYKGYVQADAYGGYDRIESDVIKRLGCMAHARRKFAEILKQHPRHAHANAAICQIKAIYKIEDEIRINNRALEAAGQPIDYDKIKKKRQTEALPLLTKLHAWLLDLQPKAPPQGPLGKAINYSLNNWSKLILYAEDGRLNIDNNPVENIIRPFAIGRKNWLFCGNHKGARAAALIYSLIESAKANHLKPFEYLKYLLTEIKFATTDAALLKLLPHHAKLDLNLDLHYKVKPSG